jgi:hypothetical protein
MLMMASFLDSPLVEIRVGAERMRGKPGSTGRVTDAGVDYTRGGQA